MLHYWKRRAVFSVPRQLKRFPLKDFNDLHEGSTVSPENPSLPLPSACNPPPAHSDHSASSPDLMEVGRNERGEENGGRTRGRARREEEVGT
jgi:hypothetical protein